jgi:hypothetical protein
MVEIFCLAGNLKSNAMVNRIDRLSTSPLILPLCFRELVAQFVSSSKGDHGFLIERSRKSGPPVLYKRHHNLLKPFYRTVVNPLDSFNLNLTTMLQRFMAVYKSMFDSLCSKINQLTMRQPCQHQLLNQLTLMSICQGSSRFQFKWTAKIHEQIDVELLSKSSMIQTDLEFLNRTAAKNLIQGRTIDRFVKDPAKLIVHIERVMNNFVSHLTEFFLRKVPNWNRRCDRHGVNLGKKMEGQRNVI